MMPAKSSVEDDDPPSRGSVGSSGSADSEREFLALEKEDARKYLDLPPPPPAALPVNCTKGWPSYLVSRWPGDGSILKRVQEDPCTLDGLTYPVTLAFLLASLKFIVRGELTVLVLGAMAAVEERLLHETTYWGELSVCLRCRVHLVLCGPDVSCTRLDGSGGPPLASPNSDTRASSFRGTFAQYLRKHPTLDLESTVAVAYNAGFGFVSADLSDNRRLEAMKRWLPDLRSLVDSGMPAFFTQANDGEELAGEAALMAHVLGGRFLVLPTQNPFAASTRSQEVGVVSCANHSFFAIQGCDWSRVRCRGVDLSSLAGRCELQRAVREARRLGADLALLEPMTTRLHSAESSPKNGTTTSSSTVGATKKGTVHSAMANGARPPLPGAVPPPPGAVPSSQSISAVVAAAAAAAAVAAPAAGTDAMRPAKQARRGRSPPAASTHADETPIPNGCAALISAATLLREEAGRSEHPVPHYRLEVSPEEGVIRAAVSLPLLESASDVDLEVYRGELLVAVKGVYSMLKVTLPSPIKEGDVVATFDRKRRLLELTLQTLEACA